MSTKRAKSVLRGAWLAGRFLFAVLALLVAGSTQAQDKKGKKDAAKSSDEDKPFVSSPSTIGNIPIWQLRPFDRLGLKNDEKTTIDLEPDRLPKDAHFDHVEDGKYCGQPGLPWPGTRFKRTLWYRFTMSSDGRKYEVIGEGIAKIEHYEDIVHGALMGELAKDIDRVTSIKFDDCLEMLRILQERRPDEPRTIFSRIRYHAAEANAALFKQDWERGLMALLEEKKLNKRVPEGVRPPQEVRSLTPVDLRIGELCDRWTTFLVNTNKFEDGRRVVARLEVLLPNDNVAKKWRSAYDQRVRAIVQRAEQQIANNFFIEALATLDTAVDVQPDHPMMRATMDRVFDKHSRLRVAVGELPGYHSGPPGWSPADVRSADLLHEPLMRVKSSKDGATEFESRLVGRFDVSDLNRKMLVEIVDGLHWPDGKLVTPVDVQRVFADARHRGGIYYHPALEFLLTNVQSEPPNDVLLEFDRPQFQARAWLQLPFMRMGGADAVGWTGMGPFAARERRPDRIQFLANSKYLQPGRPNVRQFVELRIAAPEDRIRAIQTGDVEMVDFVPFKNLPYVKNAPGVKTVKLATPKVNILQMNFDREALRRPTMRRALVYALNRAAILERVGAAGDKDVKLLTGPLPEGAFGYNKGTQQWAHEPLLAKTLVAAVAKELKAVPPLTLAHQGNESTRLACEEIAKQLQAAGLQVNLIEIDERAPDPRRADLRYQTYTVSDPIFDLITVVTRDNPSLFANAGPRLRQFLVELLRTPNVTEASKLMPEIHQALRDEVAVIPLWQWNETCLVSEAISSMPTPLARPYQNIADWKATPRYPPAHWETKPLTASTPTRPGDPLAARSEVRP